jgi:hypothetical protein
VVEPTTRVWTKMNGYLLQSDKVRWTPFPGQKSG